MRHLRLAGYQSSVCQRLISVPNSLDATEPPWSNMFWTIRVVKFLRVDISPSFQLPSEETLKNQIERELKALRDEG
jgi:hypothetical protein